MLPDRRALCLAAAAGLAGCGGPPLVGVRTPTVAGIDWSLVELDGRPVERALRPDGTPAPSPTLRLDGNAGRAQGSTGLNTFTGSYQQTGSTLTFGPLASTRRAGPPPAMALESALLKALEATASAQVDDDGLALLDEQARVRARFAPGPRP